MIGQLTNNHARNKMKIKMKISKGIIFGDVGFRTTPHFTTSADFCSRHNHVFFFTEEERQFTKPTKYDEIMIIEKAVGENPSLPPNKPLLTTVMPKTVFGNVLVQMLNMRDMLVMRLVCKYTHDVINSAYSTVWSPPHSVLLMDYLIAILKDKRGCLMIQDQYNFDHSLRTDFKRKIDYVTQNISILEEKVIPSKKRTIRSIFK